MISTEIGSAAHIIGRENAVEAVAKAGFDAWDLTMGAMAQPNYTTHRLKRYDHPLTGREYLTYVRRLKKVGDDNGIVCNQAHAPFPTNWQEIQMYLPRALECAAEAGAKCCVIHPMNRGTVEENAELYQCLLPFAKSFGVKIATENMWNFNADRTQVVPAACSDPQSFVSLLEAVNDPYLVACLDLGHAQMKGLNTTPAEMVRALGHHMEAIHIHDNGGISDDHDLPFNGVVDFPEVIRAMREIHYTGDFTMECCDYIARADESTLHEYLCNAASAARKLEAMFRGQE